MDRVLDQREVDVRQRGDVAEQVALEDAPPRQRRERGRAGGQVGAAREWRVGQAREVRGQGSGRGEKRGGVGKAGGEEFCWGS